jgi:hypothetical protein
MHNRRRRDRVDLRRNTSDPSDFSAPAMGGLLALRGDKGAPMISIALAGGEVDIDSPEDLAQPG